MEYGKNLTWFLSEVSLADTEQFETGSIEIIGENVQGQEGSTEVEIPDLALAAKNRIEELEKLLATSAEREQGMAVAIEHLQNNRNILMSKENPRGHKLEDLMVKLQNEVNAKNNKILNDKSNLSLTVQGNNLAIMKHLNEIKNLQVYSFDLMAEKAPDNGPNGQPRIG